MKNKKEKEPKNCGCDCLTKVNETLKEKGAEISTETLISFATGKVRTSNPVLKLEKLRGSKKPLPVLFCSYCPFCGKKYPD